MDWSKFDANAEVMDELKKEVESMDGDNGERKEIPVGDYEVTVTKIEMKESKSGKPMVTIWMKIVTGPYKNQIIFYNQLIDKAFGIHLVKQFFAPFNLANKVVFESYSQFATMMETTMMALKNVEFALSYTINDKGWSEYRVIQIFEF